jgi:hypothetical protein
MHQIAKKENSRKSLCRISWDRLGSSHKNVQEGRGSARRDSNRRTTLRRPEDKLERVLGLRPAIRVYYLVFSFPGKWTLGTRWSAGFFIFVEGGRAPGGVLFASLASKRSKWDLQSTTHVAA